MLLNLVVGRISLSEVAEPHDSREQAFSGGFVILP